MSAWTEARAIIGETRVTLGPQASQQWLEAPDHLAMVLARYRAASALIGTARSVREVGCGEGVGSGILARGRRWYFGIDIDMAALEVAHALHVNTLDPMVDFNREDILTFADGMLGRPLVDATVALDVIEHIPADYENVFLSGITDYMNPDGVCVIGTPNAAFDHLASPQSKAGHINTYTHERLHALMTRHFRLVQSFGMQDTSLHLGHPEARHYLLMSGVGPR